MNDVIHKCVYVYGERRGARRVLCTDRSIPLWSEKANFHWKRVTCEACKKIFEEKKRARFPQP